MTRRREARAEQTLNDINMLQAKPSTAEVRGAWLVMGGLVLACLLTVPFASKQWVASTLLFAGAGIAAFAEITAGTILLSQALPLRHDAGLALGLGYLLGGAVIIVNLLFVRDVATRLWMFRLWHAVFVLGVLVYALLHARTGLPFKRSRFWARTRLALGGAGLFIVLLLLYLAFRPFPLPVIIHGVDFVTFSDVLVNGIELGVMLLAWFVLLTARNKTVLSVWMTVVACAVSIDIVLFVLGGRLFSVGLYISKLNNLIAATLIFGVILYRYVRIQKELFRHQAWLVRSNRRLARLASTDTLTGLPNRVALDQFMEHALARATRHETLLAVCVIDLDDFKPVNDRHGHEMGDRLLAAFSRRLSGVLRKEEYFARLGGDEFVLVLEDLRDIDHVPLAMKRITESLMEPFALSDQLSVTVSASIGVAVYPYVENGRDLMRVADQALYRSKRDKVGRDLNWAMHEVAGMPKPTAVSLLM